MTYYIQMATHMYRKANFIRANTYFYIQYPWL